MRASGCPEADGVAEAVLLAVRRGAPRLLPALLHCRDELARVQKRRRQVEGRVPGAAPALPAVLPKVAAHADADLVHDVVAAATSGTRHVVAGAEGTCQGGQRQLDGPPHPLAEERRNAAAIGLLRAASAFARHFHLEEARAPQTLPRRWRHGPTQQSSSPRVERRRRPRAREGRYEATHLADGTSSSARQCPEKGACRGGEQGRRSTP